MGSDRWGERFARQTVDRSGTIIIEENVTGRHMRIAGKTDHRDLKIINGRVNCNGWRGNRQRLDPADIQNRLNVAPGTLVIGTGYAGAMLVPDASLASTTLDRGVHVIGQPTTTAVKTFNRLAAEKAALAGAFHLTC